jgi:hypothetical protein
MLPQQFREWFAQEPRRLNIDDPKFIECLPPPCHIGKGGVHSNQQGEPSSHWNARWQNFIANNPDASASQVLDFLSQMRTMFRGPLGCQ